MNRILRCPTDKARPHSTYSTCGAFLCALIDSKIIIYCSKCNSYYELITHNKSVELKKLPKTFFTSDPFIEVLS